MARKKASRKPVVTCPSCGYEADPAAGTVNFCPGCGKDLRAAADDPSRGGPFVHRVIADRYRLLALLGEGGMGAVYKAEHIRMGKALALKILRGDFAREPGAAERFLAEARIVSRLSHPHTIAVFDFGEIDAAGSGFYLAMEYVSGNDLAAVLRDRGPLSEPRVADIGQQILGSLGEAHDAGIVHRDVKPGNVMLMRTRAGEDFVKVLDFGIAKLRHAGPEGGSGKAALSSSATSAGAIVGTPSYVAPEQARGAGVDARSDLYAVGCLLYELAAGRPPFVAPTPMAIVAAHLHQEPPPLTSVAPGVSRKLAEVIHRALRKRPEERFAGADEMREALAAVSEPTGAHALGDGGPQLTGELGIARREDFAEFERELRALRRSRVLAPLAALLALAAVALAIWRWPDLYAAAAARAPRIAALVPAALRPTALTQDEEHEPNDGPAFANPLAIPPGPDGAPAGGTAAVRGHVGAKLSATSGDVDVYRLELPPIEGRKVVVAEWRGELPGQGIRGLDVALALNRERAPQGGRIAAPLVASADRGGPGQPERLVAAAEAGVHYLTVREQHGADGPVEKPTDRYVLEVRIADPAPGEEVEPNDAPDGSGPDEAGYARWRALAAWNVLAEGGFVRGETSPHDPDLFAVEGGAEDAPALVVALPDPGLALAARRSLPAAEGVAAERSGGGVRFEEAGDAGPGEVLLVPLGAVPRPGAPVLVQLRGAAGEGSYAVAALGSTPASAAAVLARVRALAEAGRTAQALELAAAFAANVSAASRDDVLLAAGAIAQRAAGEVAPDGLAAYERASQLLGAAILETEGSEVRYRGAFEGRAAGAGGADRQDEGPAPEDRPSSSAGAAP
jgi:serine/threonine-protein kinase